MRLLGTGPVDRRGMVGHAVAWLQFNGNAIRLRQVEVRQIEANVRAAREAGEREAILFDAWWFEQAATTDQPLFYREMAKALPPALA